MCDTRNTNTEFKYTIAMCNLNNAETLEESINSIAGQVDDRFELLIVDDGSTDGSIEILEHLKKEITNLRVVIGDNDNLGEARNNSFREASGEHILESMDLDDKYHHGILDFVKIYEGLCDQLDDDFYLKGNSINIAPRRLLIKYPYRSMGYGEDADLWRRLFANDKIIWLDHEPFYEQIREEDTILQRMKNNYDKAVVDFRSGVSLNSFVRYCVKNIFENVTRYAYFLIICIPSYIRAQRLGRFEPPAPEFRKKGMLEKKIADQSMRLQEFKQQFGVDPEKLNLSDKGKRLF